MSGFPTGTPIAWVNNRCANSEGVMDYAGTARSHWSVIHRTAEGAARDSDGETEGRVLCGRSLPMAGDYWEIETGEKVTALRFERQGLWAEADKRQGLKACKRCEAKA